MENSRQPRRRTKAARVQQEIIERINSGIYLGKLPGVNQLAQEFAVNPLTISKVLRNLSELGLVYQRERIGTFVGRKRRIGFLIFKSDRDRQGNPDHLISYYKIIRGCARVMEPEHLTLHSLVAASNEVEAIEQLKREVDALVFSTAGSVSEEELAITAGVPRVRVLGDYRQRSGYPQITYDNDAIGPLAAEYLVRCGCRRFITFGPLPENLNASRYRSFAARVAEFGHRVTELPLDPYFLPFSEYMEQGRRKLAPALESREPTGIFVPNDLACTPLYQIIYQLGRNPAEFTIVGCDNNDFHLHGLYPRPVAIDIRMEDIGRDAAHVLLEIINGRRPADDCDKIIKTPELVIPSSLVCSAAGYELQGGAADAERRVRLSPP